MEVRVFQLPSVVGGALYRRSSAGVDVCSGHGNLVVELPSLVPCVGEVVVGGVVDSLLDVKDQLPLSVQGESVFVVGPQRTGVRGHGADPRMTRDPELTSESSGYATSRFAVVVCVLQLSSG